MRRREKWASGFGRVPDTLMRECALPSCCAKFRAKHRDQRFCCAKHRNLYDTSIRKPRGASIYEMAAVWEAGKSVKHPEDPRKIASSNAMREMVRLLSDWRKADKLAREAARENQCHDA